MKRYIAILNQNGASDPVATVLENSLGPIVWTRATEGQYIGTLDGAFPASKTIAFCSGGQGGTDATIAALILPVNSDDYVVIQTKDLDMSNPSCDFTDNMLLRTAVAIFVY